MPWYKRLSGPLFPFLPRRASIFLLRGDTFLISLKLNLDDQTQTDVEQGGEGDPLRYHFSPSALSIGGFEGGNGALWRWHVYLTGMEYLCSRYVYEYAHNIWVFSNFSIILLINTHEIVRNLNNHVKQTKQMYLLRSHKHKLPSTHILSLHYLQFMLLFFPITNRKWIHDAFLPMLFLLLRPSKMPI